MASALTALLVATLFALAGIHVYWGLGGYWPGTDEVSAVERIVGRTRGMKMPGLFASSVVAACLTLTAMLVSVRAGFVLTPLAPHLVIRLALFGAAAVFLLRGAAGYIPPLFAYARGTPFHHLNLVFYSPLCLAIGLGLLAVDRIAATSPEARI